ncbi:MAG: threonine synthase [Fidelibacterota bacterium]
MARFICTRCQTSHPIDSALWRCPCGGVLDILHRVRIPVETVKSRARTLWRYRETLPLDDDRNRVTFQEGYTPLVPARFGPKKVLLKLEYLFPSGSFKDRGTAVLVSKLKELGVTSVIGDSSGNAGLSLAMYGARGGLECRIYVPPWPAPVTVEMMKTLGASVVVVEGSRSDVERAAQEGSLARNSSPTKRYAGHNWHPFFLEGTKTFAYEVAEQLGWTVPDAVLFPVGNGSLLLGAYRGFGDLLRLGLVERMPRLIGVQPERCAPIVRAFRDNRDTIEPVEPGETVAEGTSLPDPPRGTQVLQAVRESGGSLLSVTEEEIVASLERVRRMGYLIQPTSAVATAGLEKYPFTSRDRTVVAPLTGWGMSRMVSPGRVA